MYSVGKPKIITNKKRERVQMRMRKRHESKKVV